MKMNFFVRVGKLLLPSLLLCNFLNAQSSLLGQYQKDGYNTITTAVPFLRISPEARAGAMGDAGLAIEADANSHYWNIAKMVNNKKSSGIALTYTPWLKQLVPDISLSYITGYKKFGEDENQCISGSMRYFNLGSIDYTTIDATPAGSGRPREFSFDAGYSRKLTEDFSIGITGRYIRSHIAAGAPPGSSGNYKPGSAFGIDLGVFYSKLLKEDADEYKSDRLNISAAITNLGSKISYSSIRKDFIPTNLGVGVAYIHQMDEYNKITVAADFNKLLVPSPQIKEVNGQLVFEYPWDKGVMEGVFSSFGDAPGGGKEELQEVTESLGFEYSYQNSFFARAGYFNEARYKGNRKFATVGAGFKYNVMTIDLSYVIPAGPSTQRNPLSNTLRFSLTLDIAKAKAKAVDPDADTNSKDE